MTTRDSWDSGGPLVDALLELVGRLGDLVDATREQLDRDADRYPSVSQADRLSLVRQFADECLVAVDVDSNPVDVVRVHDAYLEWCDERHLRGDDTLPFSGLMTALRNMGFARTDEPVERADGRLRHGLVRTRLRGFTR